MQQRKGDSREVLVMHLNVNSLQNKVEEDAGRAIQGPSGLLSGDKDRWNISGYSQLPFLWTPTGPRFNGCNNENP